MAMMIGILDKSIKDMKNLRQREERRDNKAAQEALDQRFSVLTSQIHSLMLALQYTKEKMQFQLNGQILIELESLLQESKGIVKSGFAEKDPIAQVENAHKTVQQNIKKDWAKYYSSMTNSTKSTLQVISGIDTEKVAKCLDGIAKGASWTTNIGDFKVMNQSLAEAKYLIDGLGLDQQIIAFLLKMKNGKATVMDLDENVLRWLRDESLDRRVKLSFVGGSRRG